MVVGVWSFLRSTKGIANGIVKAPESLNSLRIPSQTVMDAHARSRRRWNLRVVCIRRRFLGLSACHGVMRNDVVFLSTVLDFIRINVSGSAKVHSHGYCLFIQRKWIFSLFSTTAVRVWGGCVLNIHLKRSNDTPACAYFFFLPQFLKCSVSSANLE